MALGETPSTAYPGDKGKANRDALNSMPTKLTSYLTPTTSTGDLVKINYKYASKDGLNYVPLQDDNIDIPSATTTNAGAMSAIDKGRLDDLYNEFGSIQNPGDKLDSLPKNLVTGVDATSRNATSVTINYKQSDLSTASNSYANPITKSPLPRFIKRETEKEDMERFQCIFAKNEGAVTAPTSGLHFSRELMKRMEIKGIDFAFVTMHCGLGNFREIDVEDLTKHKMDSEEMFVSAEACRIVNQAKDTGHKVCAVGTTVQRTIESAVGTDCHLKEFQGWTNKFIFPPYEFSVADSMVANFYLPYSTLLMLTAAYGGYELVMEAYNQALKEGYRFGTYGDAMLILND